MSEQILVPAPSAQGAQRFHTLCKRVFHADPAYFPRAKYRGKIVYFCTEACLEAFQADPDYFYYAHSTPGSQKQIAYIRKKVPVNAGAK